MQGLVIKYDKGAKDSQPNSAQLYPIVNGSPKLSACLDVPRHNHPLIRWKEFVRVSLKIERRAVENGPLEKHGAHSELPSLITNPNANIISVGCHRKSTCGSSTKAINKVTMQTSTNWVATTTLFPIPVVGCRGIHVALSFLLCVAIFGFDCYEFLLVFFI